MKGLNRAKADQILTAAKEAPDTLTRGIRKLLRALGEEDETHLDDGGPVYEKRDGANVLAFDNLPYQALLGDIDRDKIPNVDDPHPTQPGDTESIEETKAATTFSKLLELKGLMDEKLTDKVLPKVKQLTPQGAQVYARTKSPFSIIKKLVEKRMLDSNKPSAGLTDLVGTQIIAKDKAQLNQIRQQIEGSTLRQEGALGDLIEMEDFYANPNHGYRAVHYLFWSDEGPDRMPVELQLKTERMKFLNELGHEAYKSGRLNAERLQQLTDLANRADEGSKEAIEEFDRLKVEPETLRRSMYRDGTMAKGWVLQKFTITNAKEDLADIFGE